jgi:hypothetical protein
VVVGHWWRRWGCFGRYLRIVCRVSRPLLKLLNSESEEGGRKRESERVGVREEGGREGKGGWGG